MPVAGGHRVWLREMLLRSNYNDYKYDNLGYYVVGVPISLFRALRPSGCFNVHLLQCHRQENALDLFHPPNFQLRLTIVLNYLYYTHWCARWCKTKLASSPSTRSLIILHARRR